MKATEGEKCCATHESTALGTIMPPPSILTVLPTKATRISSTVSGLPRPTDEKGEEEEAAAAEAARW